MQERDQRPVITFDNLDFGPEELRPQLPLRGELVRVIPGPDRPDYCLVLLTLPIWFTLPEGFDAGRFHPPSLVQHNSAGEYGASIPMVVVAARLAGQQLHPGMKDLAVNLAYVIDTTQAGDAAIDFAKLEYVAVLSVSSGDEPSGPA